MKKAILCVLLTLSMSVSAFALEVPNIGVQGVQTR